MNTIILRFIIFQLCIWAPIISGSYCSQFSSLNIQKISDKLILINLVSLESFIVLWTIWGLELSNFYFILPFGGVALVLIGLIVGIVLSHIAGFTNIQKHTFIISASLANHGFTMGGFVCYVFLGERGLALSFIFISYFMPYVIVVIFSYARFIGSRTAFSLKKYLLAPQNMPLYAVLLAIILQLSNIKRPQLSVPLDIMLAISLIIYYFSIGIHFRCKHILSYTKAHILLAGTKFFIVPLITFTFLSFIHLPNDIYFLILIQSCMPAAIYSVITSVLFELDKEMATSMFVVNTVIFSAIGMPLLIYLFH